MPSITVTGKGDYNKQLQINDLSQNKIFKSNTAIVGHPIEVAHDSSLSFNSATLNFKISSDVLAAHKLENLEIAYYDDSTNTLTPIKTAVDKNTGTISAAVSHFSDYCVVDAYILAQNWLVNVETSTTKAGKADVVFAIDTTGSMGGTISNVSGSINNLVDKLKAKNVDARFGLVEFKDIQEDGADTTVDHGWYTDTASFKSAVGGLVANGGGDTPESDVDGLEKARLKSFRSGVKKYIILITDTYYKNGTTYSGLSSMDDEITRLKNSGICVSVVSNTSELTTYSNLFSGTSGIFADINQDFSTAIEPLIGKIENETSGYWVRLSDGTLVQLDEDPAFGDYDVDSDKDGIPDLDELGKQTTTTVSDPTTGDTKVVHCWTYKTNPANKDTDGDGISDKFDKRPTKYDVTAKRSGDKIILNNGKKWNYFGISIEKFLTGENEIISNMAGESTDIDIGVPLDKLSHYYNALDNNNKVDFNADELAAIFIFDQNAVRYYLDDQSTELINSVFRDLTGRNVQHYYYHTSSGYVDEEAYLKGYFISFGRFNFGDMFPQKYSEAELSLTVNRCKYDRTFFLNMIAPLIMNTLLVLFSDGMAALDEGGIAVVEGAAEEAGIAETSELVNNAASIEAAEQELKELINSIETFNQDVGTLNKYIADEGLSSLSVSSEDILAACKGDVELAKDVVSTVKPIDSTKSLAELIEEYKIPETPAAQSLNAYQARIWYNWKLSKAVDTLDYSKPLEDVAKQALETENKLWNTAKESMVNRSFSDAIFGNKAYTFEEVVNNLQAEGLEGDDLWKSIIGNSTKSADTIDSELGINAEQVTTLISDLKNTENFADNALEHIFDGAVNAKGKVTGYHYEGMPTAQAKVIPGTYSVPNEYGVYMAKVEINGVPKAANGGESTFFPRSWSTQDVVDAINEAYKNRILKGGNRYECEISSGMKIRMFINGDGKIISAFPIY